MEEHELNQIADHPLLTRDEEIALALRIRAGDEDAVQLLARNNLRLVVNVVRHYVTPKLSLGDCVGYGVLGLMEAARKFDPDRGCKFSTIAVPYILRHLRRCEFELGGDIRVPVYLQQAARDMHKGKSVATKVQALVAKSQVCRQIPLSIDSFVSNVIYRREFAIDPTVDRESTDELAELIHTLPPRSQAIVCKHFGLAGYAKMTLQAIGQEHGITKQRTSQIIIEAIAQMREAAGENDDARVAS